MLYGFAIAPSINEGEPSTRYFEAIRHSAMRAVTTAQPDAQAAFDACEYLDCVDAGSLENTPSLYQRAVALLSDYLDTCPRLDAHTLAGRSWAAQTVLEVIRESKANEPRAYLKLA